MPDIPTVRIEVVVDVLPCRKGEGDKINFGAAEADINVLQKRKDSPPPLLGSVVAAL
jgi:hypothetical protein